MFILIGLLFLARAIFVWYGFDRSPLIASSEESLCNDPAFSLNKTGDYTAKSFRGTLQFDKLYGFHPPVYAFVQAAVFRLGGVSFFTLRMSNISFFIIYTFLLLLLFHRLKRAGICDAFSFFWMALLLLSDPTTFKLARIGRPESLCLFFGISAFLVLFPSGQITISKKRWILSAILIGLALATHTEMVLWWVAYAMLAVVIFNKKNRSSILLLIGIPILVFMFCWIMAQKGQWWAALLQHYHLKKALGDELKGFPIVNFLSCGFHGSLSERIRGIMQYGGFSIFLVAMCWIVTGLRTAHELISGKQKKSFWFSCLVFLFVSAAAQFILTQFVLGSLTQRAIVILPLALICFGAAISHAHKKYAIARVINMAGATLVLMGLAGHIIYIASVHREWSARSPDRFSEFVREIPSDARVAAASPWWFELIKNNHTVCVIGSGVAGDLQYRTDPKVLNNYDVVILPAGANDATFFQALEHGVRRDIRVGDDDFIILSKVGRQKIL